MSEFLYLCLIPILAGIPALAAATVVVGFAVFATDFIGQKIGTIIKEFIDVLDRRGGVDWGFVANTSFAVFSALLILWVFGAILIMSLFPSLCQ